MKSHSQIVDSQVVQRVVELSAFSISYIVLMAISGVLSAIALLTNSVPVLIGSMVIAPALPPLVLVSIGAVNRRPRLALDGAISAALGLSIAMTAAIVITVFFNATGVLPDETSLLDRALLQERVSPGWYSVVTAIAAGIAGMLALTQEKTRHVSRRCCRPCARACGRSWSNCLPFRRSLSGLGWHYAIGN